MDLRRRDALSRSRRRPYCHGETAQLVATITHGLHGGIGVTEYPPALPVLPARMVPHVLLTFEA